MFREAVVAGIESWETLQCFLEKDGNSKGQRFNDYLIEYTIQLFEMNDDTDLTDIEVADELHNEINRSYDLKIDDGTDDPVAAYLVEAHRFCKRFDLLRERMDQLPS